MSTENKQQPASENPLSRKDVDRVDEPDLLVTPESAETPVVSVVLPTLNEEQGIQTCIRWIREAIQELGLPTEILVSDSSTDQTPEIAQRLGARVVTPDGGGYGRAYQYAFERVRGEYVVMGDADTTYDFREIPRLLSPVFNGSADIVLGSRLAGEIKDGAMPALHKYVGNPLLTRFLNSFYDAGVSDAHSGFRVVTREVIEDLEFDSPGMEFASEMIMAAGASRFRIDEVPITYHKRTGNATLDSFQDGWRHIKFMLMNAPTYLYSVPGVTAMIAGILLSSLSLLNSSILGQQFGTFTLIYGSLFAVTGFQALCFGVFTDMATDPVCRTDHWTSQAIQDHLTLERGLLTGALLLAAGGLLVGYYLSRWYTSGFSRLPDLSASILALVGVIAGIQLILISFFLNILKREN